MKIPNVSLKYSAIFLIITLSISVLITWVFNFSFWICFGLVALGFLANGFIASIEDKDFD
jgi:hypothetical protein